jgi:hypothetical protein
MNFPNSRPGREKKFFVKKRHPEFERPVLRARMDEKIPRASEPASVLARGMDSR